MCIGTIHLHNYGVVHFSLRKNVKGLVYSLLFNSDLGFVCSLLRNSV